jgi:hypothetical protein
MQTHTIVQQRGARLAPRETAILRAMFSGRPPVDSIEGWDEMQGYPDGGAYGNGYDVVGVPGYDTVGAWYNPFSWGRHPAAPAPAPNPMAAMMAMRGAMPMRPQLPGPPMLPAGAYQGLQAGPRRLLSYMGLGSLSWTHATTETEQPMVAEPQAAFRGRRLVIAQAKSDGATGILAVVSDPLTVSGMPQTPAPNVDAPVEMFEASTTYSMLDLQIATSATQITLAISVSAIPASGETVNVSAGLYGEWLR